MRSPAALAPVIAVTVEGVSRRSWADALHAAVRRAANVVPHVTSVDVTRSRAIVRAGKIVEYRVEVAVTPASDARPDAVPHTWCCEPW